MNQHGKPPSAKRRLDTAFKALCDISFLGVDADGQDARRIAQEALLAMQMDTVAVVIMEEGARLRATSAAGNVDSERTTLEHFGQAVNAILEAQGVPVQFSEIVMVDDYPKPKGET